MEAGKSRLKGDSLREANRGEVKALHREIGHLKELVAEQAIQLALHRELRPIGHRSGGGLGRDGDRPGEAGAGRHLPKYWNGAGR